MIAAATLSGPSIDWFALSPLLILLGAALFGLGSAVRIRTLLHTGGRALLAALASWFLIAVLGLAAALLIAG